MFLTHGAVKVGRGKLFGVEFSLACTPVDEEAVAQSPEHAHDPHGLRMLDTAVRQLPDRCVRRRGADADRFRCPSLRDSIPASAGHRVARVRHW